MAVASANIEVASAYAAHSSSVTRYLTSLIRDPEAAEDLAQEAFIRLIGEVEAGRGPTNVRGWLFRVAANLAASRGRHLAVVTRRAPEIAIRENAAAPDVEVCEMERARAVHAALARVREADREIVMLAAAGFDGSEIAARLGISEIAARTRLCRARARVRDELVSDGFEASEL